MHLKKFIFATLLAWLHQCSPIWAQSEDDPYLLSAPVLELVSQQLVGDLADGKQDVWRLVVPEGLVALASAQLSDAEDSGARLQLIAIERDGEQQITSRADLSEASLLPMLSGQQSDMPERLLDAGEYILGIAPYKAGLGQYQIDFDVEMASEDATELDTDRIWRVSAGEVETCHQFVPREPSQLTLFVPHKAWVQIRIVNRDDGSPLLRGEIAPLWQIDGLPAGDYDICLRGKEVPVAARVSSATRQNGEREPNDEQESANALLVGSVLNGTLTRRGSYPDRDWIALSEYDDGFSLELAADPRAEVHWKLANAEGAVLKQGSFVGRTRITPLGGAASLFLQLSADRRITYRLRRMTLDPARSGAEREPNDTIPSASDLPLGVVGSGELSEGDRDFFALNIDGLAQLWRVQVDGLALRGLRVHSIGGQVLAERQLDDAPRGRISSLYLPPGPYFIEVAGLGRYSLRMLPQGPRQNGLEVEPNSDTGAENNLDFDVAQRGMLERGDIDKFRFSLRSDERINLQIDPPFSEEIVATLNGPGGRIWQEVLKGGQDKLSNTSLYHPGSYVLELAPRGRETGLDDYRVLLAPVDPFDVLSTLKLSTTKDVPVPQAFLRGHNQQLPIELRAEPKFSSDEVNVSLHSSTQGWKVAEQEVTATPTGLIPVDIIAPPDLDQEPVRLTLKLQSDSEVGTHSFVITPDPLAAALEPKVAFALPIPLLGGLNVAASAMGGHLVDQDGAPLPDQVSGLNNHEALIDGVAPALDSFSFARSAMADGVTVKLSGQDPLPISGVILTARNALGKAGTLREFAIEVSVDGKRFVPVLTETMSPAPIAQPFVFERPTLATHLRLIPNSAWTFGNSESNSVHLSELAVIAEPGFVPLRLTPINLADPQLGGHVVWTETPLGLDGPWDIDLLVGGDTEPDEVRGAPKATFVLGFHHARQAQLAAIGWDTASLTGAALQNATLVAEVSLQSPLGPWRQAERWELPQTTEPGAPARLAFSEIVRARYLRLTVQTAADDATSLRLPDQVLAWEAETESGSIFGEWGEFVADTRAPQLPVSILKPAGGNTLGAAELLPLNKWQSSTIPTDTSQDWWIFENDQGPGVLRLEFVEPKNGGVRAELFAPDMTKVSLHSDLEMPGAVSARLETQGRYFLKIHQERRALIVAYDTSGSTYPYRAQLRRALFDIAEASDPERDLIGFLPFGGDILGHDLTGDPEILLRRLTSDRGGVKSSAAETALGKAADALVGHNGPRAVIMITDAATSRDLSLWSKLDEVRPVVAAVAIPATDATNSTPQRERDLMESWAMISDGSYDYVSSQLDFRAAFERARARLKTAQPYRIRATIAPPSPPIPGTLRITMAGNDNGKTEVDAPASALMILLDNSGSMLKRQSGQPRYQIAQTAIRDLLGRMAVGQTSVGLRVFGVSADKCETNLMAPPGPPSTAFEAIADIKPQDLAKTPIAMALEAAAGDLADFPVRRIIVLTDGEETCDGDPGAVIARLRSEGTAARIDIIGFQIDNPDLAAKFESWANSGGGAYRNANSADSLGMALRRAARPLVRIIAADGSVITSQIGDPDLSLFPGTYRVAVDGSSSQLEVQIRPGEMTVASLDLNTPPIDQ